MTRAPAAALLLLALSLALLQLGAADPSVPPVAPPSALATQRRSEVTERVAIARAVRSQRRRARRSGTVVRPRVVPWFDPPAVADRIPPGGVRWIIRVKDGDGEPVPGAVLTDGPDLEPSDIHGGDVTGEFRPFEAVTGPDGIAVIDTESAARVSLRAQKDGRFALLPGIFPVPGQRIVLDLVLTPQVTIECRVITQDGKPIADAALCSTMYPSESTRRPGGAFSVAGPAGNPIHESLLVYAAGFMPRLVAVNDPDRPLTVELEREITIRGKVLAPSGGPASEIDVTLAGETVDWVTNHPVSTEHDGRFELPWMPGKDAWLVIGGESFAPLLLPVAAADGDLDVGAHRLDSGTPVTGSVAHPDGAPLANGVATLISDGLRLATTRVHGGSFRFAAVGAGPYSVEVCDSQGPGSVRITDVRGGGVVRATLTLRHVLSVRMVDTAGREVDSVPMTVSAGLPCERREAVGRRVVFERPGVHDVVIEPRGHWPVVLRDVPITEFGETERTVELVSLHSE